MATLGFGVIVYIVFNEYVSLTGGPSGFGEIPRFSLFGMQFDTTIRFYYLAWFLAILVLILSLNIVNSRVGRALRAIHGSELAATSLGVDAAKYKVQIFVLSATYGAVAGSLYAHYVTFVNPPPFDIFFSIKLLMMVVIGGTGSVWGAFAGAGLLTFLPEWLTFLEDFDVLAYGMLLLVIVMFLPEGVIGLGNRLYTFGLRVMGKT
jgi:branched-chain amino acid transport system permease protein